MPAPASSRTGESGCWRRDLLLLALAFLALYFFRLGSYPLGNPDEGRNAEIPREMLVTGDWVTPRLDGVNYFEKPPLVYWVTAVAEEVLGLNEWAVRSVPALFAVFGVLLTYAAARALYGRATGWFAAVVQGTSLLWFVVGHIPILDTAVSVFMGAALFCFIAGQREPEGRRRFLWFMGLYASAALATLTKGLMGFLVTGAILFLWLLLFNRWKRLLPLHLFAGAALFLAIALPWHVLAAVRNPNWFHRYIVFEHFLRFLTPAASRVAPWHFFIWVAIGGLFPWTGFLWTAVRRLVKRGWSGRSEDAESWFFVTWALFILVFFSISKSKLAPYLLPAFPALAVLIGRELAMAIAGGARLRAGPRFVSFSSGLLAAAIAIVLIRPGIVRMDPVQAAALRAPAIAVEVILIAGGVLVPWRFSRTGARSLAMALAGMMAFFFGALEFAAPSLNKPGTKELALYVKSHARPGDRVFTCYDFYQDFTFYAQRLVGVVGNYAELELSEDPAARESGRFTDDAHLRKEWDGSTRIFLVVQPRRITDVRNEYAHAYAEWKGRAELARRAHRPFAEREPSRPIFADPTFHYHLIRKVPDFYLLSNRSRTIEVK